MSERILTASVEWNIKDVPYLQNCLVYDIECDSFDIAKSEIKFIGAYSFFDKKYYFIPKTKLSFFQQLLDRHSINSEGTKQYHHKVLVGFNNKTFDGPILNNEVNKFRTEYKTIIDTLKILYDHEENKPIREQLIKLKDGTPLTEKLENRKLGTIAQAIGLSVEKGDIDYNIFKKNEWTDDELTSINKYLFNDVMMTKGLFEFLCDYFRSFIDDMSYSDIKKFNWLKTSTGSYAYKVICHKCGLPEEYSEEHDVPDKPGGYVREPLGEHYEDVMYCDAASMYPHIMMMFNIFKKGDWHGNSMFEVKGSYDTKEMGPVSKLIKETYHARKLMKKNKDSRELSKKIFMNCFSEDTEVLTTNGVKLVKDCSVGEMVYSINPKTKSVEIKPITDVQRFSYSEEMIHWKTSRVDELITPNHRCIVQRIGRDDAEFIDVKSLMKISRTRQLIHSIPSDGERPKKFSFLPYVQASDELSFRPKNMYQRMNGYETKRYVYDDYSRHFITNKFDESIDAEWFVRSEKKAWYVPLFVDIIPLLKFLGYYISEGHRYVNKPKKYENGFFRGTCHRIDISQYKKVNQKIYHRIESCLKEIGFRYTKNERSFYICSKFLYSFLDECGSMSGGIHLPDWVWSLHPSLLKVLHDALYDGNGTKGRQYRYTTKSIRLRDDMLRLNLLLGYKVRYAKETNNGKNFWRIFRTSVGVTKPENFYKKKNPTSHVCCITVKDNHTCYAGRNGHFTWIGQSVYGISGTPVFKSIFDYNTAYDICSLGQQLIKGLAEKIVKNGFDVCYSDTDSLFIVTKGEHEKVRLLLSEYKKEVDANVPFPQETFIFDVQAIMKHIWFFRDEEGKLKKKCYIYVDEKNNVHMTGGEVKKDGATLLSKKIWKEYIEPNAGTIGVKYSKNVIESWIGAELKKDISIMARLFNVRDATSYKDGNGLQKQIANVYGAGGHELIANYRSGKVGMKVKYCSIEEAKASMLGVRDLDLSKVWSELSMFIREEKKQVLLTSWGAK